jgi:fluoroquinolone transport system permease protein
MRIKALVLGDMRFQYKYGFYFLYLFFILLYAGALFALPASWRRLTAVLMVFTDPAAIGLYFMGAIVLLKKANGAGQPRRLPVCPRSTCFRSLCPSG